MQQVGHHIHKDGIEQILLVRKHRRFHIVDCGSNMFCYIITPEIGEDGPVLIHIVQKKMTRPPPSTV